MYGVAFSFRSSGDHRINTPLKTFCSYSFSGFNKECPCDTITSSPRTTAGIWIPGNAKQSRHSIRFNERHLSKAIYMWLGCMFAFCLCATRWVRPIYHMINSFWACTWSIFPLELFIVSKRKKRKKCHGQMLQMNREEKSLCHDAMVVNFLDDNQAQI